MMQAALQQQTSAISEVQRVMRSGGLVLTLESKPTIFDATAPLPPLSRESSRVTEERDRRTDRQGRRWSDDDHDELIRHSEILRNVSSQLSNLFIEFGRRDAEHMALVTRVSKIENMDERRQGYEAAIKETARKTAVTQALLVSSLFGAATIIANILIPIFIKH